MRIHAWGKALGRLQLLWVPREASGKVDDMAGPSQWLVFLERAVPCSPLLWSWLLGLCTEVEAGACCHAALHCPEQLPGGIGCICLHERGMQCSCTPQHQRRCPQEATELALREEGTQLSVWWWWPEQGGDTDPHGGLSSVWFRHWGASHPAKPRALRSERLHRFMLSSLELGTGTGLRR